MKYLCALIMALASAGASAEDAKVEITSFVYAGLRTRAAELCGKITGPQAPNYFVKIIVDPKARNPGTYNVQVGSEGVFCTAVITNQGQAEASLRDSSQEGSSSFIEASGRQ